MILSAIAAMAKNRVIGKNNQLPWHIPEDLKFFRESTKQKIIIMGRKTFESLPKPLPNRLHIVITRQSDYKTNFCDVQVVNSLDAALELAQALIPKWPEEVFIVGGAEIYKQSLPRLDRIYLSVIDQSFEGDAYFPEFEDQSWKLANEVKPPSLTSFVIKTFERI